MSLLTPAQKAKIEAELKAKSDALVAQLLAGRLPEPAAIEKSCDEVEPDCTHKGCPDNLSEDGATAQTPDFCKSDYRQVMDVGTNPIQPGEGNAALPLQSPSAEMSGYDCGHAVPTFNPSSPCADTPPIVGTMCPQHGVESSSDSPDSPGKSVRKSTAKRAGFLKIRLSQAEKSALKSAAEAAGFSSVSDFLRSKIPGFAPVRARKKDAEIKKLMASHGAIGSNINQIARVLNSNRSGNVVDLLSILAALQEIKEKLDEKLSEIVGEEK